MKYFIAYIAKYCSGFISLIYPPVCQGCRRLLTVSETHICSYCLIGMPKTGYENRLDNELSEHLKKKYPIETATSLFYFIQNSPYQKMIHQLKYGKKPELGIFLGRLLGDELSKSPYYREIDIIIPVPLHPKREKKRGYNQSYMLALGIAEMMVNTKVIVDNLYRKTYTETQTHKTKEERLDNMMGIFALKEAAKFAGKNILLVDDVITTGATVIGCLQAFSALPHPPKVWVCALGHV